ncbi:hypothetical protein T06_14106 [Trichinella sp. T6]|nr:hypothetical protein T06_14106 [Trichinella sp. T6]
MTCLCTYCQSDFMANMSNIFFSVRDYRRHKRMLTYLVQVERKFRNMKIIVISQSVIAKMLINLLK